MMNMTWRCFWVIVISFFCALVLTLLPLPTWIRWLQPAWVALVLSYWVMALPHRVGIGIAWLLGIILDVLSGSMLGEHAFGLVLVAYFIIIWHKQIRVFPLAQQALAILLLLLAYQLVLFILQGMSGQMPSSWLYWISPLISMVFWPWIFIILRNCRRRFRVE